MRVGSRRWLGLAAGDLVATAAAMTLLASLTVPGLEQVRSKMNTIACANNLRACNHAFNVYADQFDGRWIAPWDRTQGMPGQWVYTMRIYANGGTIADGKPVYDEDSGWWSLVTNSRGGPMPYNDGVHVSPMHCPATRTLGADVVGMWWPYATYSYRIPMRKLSDGTWRYSIDADVKQDLMTHPATTVHLHDMYRGPGEEWQSIWSRYGFPMLDPHGGKSNYVFADGHVELLEQSQTTERMWQDMYLPATIENE